MNRNERIGTIIGTILGYAVQGFVYARIIHPKTIVLIKTTAKTSAKVINYTSKKYVRTDYTPETILSDAIDASFWAD